MFKKELKVITLKSDKRYKFKYRVENGPVGIIFKFIYDENGIWNLKYTTITNDYPTTKWERFLLKIGWYRDNIDDGVFTIYSEFVNDGKTRRGMYEEETSIKNKLHAFVTVIKHFIETEKPRKICRYVPDIGKRDDLKRVVRKIYYNNPIKGYDFSFSNNLLIIKEV